MTSRMVRALSSAFGILTCALLLSSAGAARAAPTRIMPLGDSITGSPGCWRALLWNELQRGGFTDVDMVGTLPAQGCGVPYDGDNEGHGGILATNMANANQLPPWLAATSPDVVMMHLGTNDVWSGRTNQQLLGAFTTLVNQMRSQNPSMKILVAQIIPMDARACAACGQRVVDFNAAIPAWAAGLSTAQSPITVVDQWTGFDTTTDTGDGVHPNDAGIRKISERWYPALAAALGGGAPPPSFSLSASPASQTLGLDANAAGSTTSTITVTPYEGFAGAVTLSATSLAGASISFAPNPTSPATGTSVMTMTVPANMQPGVYTTTVTGTSGTLTRSTTVTLAVERAIAQDFSLAMTPASLSLSQGASGTVSVGVARIGGFAGSVQLGVSGLPAGVTASFRPNPATGASSTLTLTASTTATTGPATVTITGTGGTGTASRSASMILTVNASGGGSGSAPCSSPVDFAGNTGNFNTTGAVCYRTAAVIHGWGCYNLDGRTLRVNDVAVSCGGALPAPWADGHTYFAVSAGTYPWAGLYAW